MWPDAPVLTGEQTVALAEAFTPEVYRKELNIRGDSDFAYQNESARYRVSVVRQRLGVEIVFRVVNSYVRTMDDLGLPQQLKLLTRYQNGLILVTGSGRRNARLGNDFSCDHRRRDRPSCSGNPAQRDCIAHT